jgi:uncharacterized SAM-binding protein YcdF (DUF218 family)
MFFYIKKIVSAFILPPGIFISLLFVIGSFLIIKRKRFFAFSLIGLAVIMWLFSIRPVTDIFYDQLVSDYTPNVSNLTADAYVVLGGGAYGKIPDIGGSGILVDDSLERVVAVVRLYRQKQLPVILSGGSVYHDASSEAEVMKRYLTELGIPENDIISESQSRDTNENAKYTNVICREKQFEKIILITSAYHMKRSMMLFQNTRLTVIPLPVGYLPAQHENYAWIDYFPGNFDHIRLIIKEYLGILYYTLST